jgi:hypothetical protein
MSSAEEKTGKQKPPALHLLWTVPLALLLGYPLWVAAEFTWCGISGCGGGGFGEYTDMAGIAVASTVLAGLLLATAIAAVPWSQSRARFLVIRLVIAFGIGTAYAIAGVFLTRY